MWELLQTLSSILHLSLLFPSWNEETFRVQREMQVWWKLGDRGLAVAAFRPETSAAFWPLIGQAAIVPASHWPRQARGYNSDPHLRWQFQLLSINRRHIFCSTSSVSERLQIYGMPGQSEGLRNVKLIEWRERVTMWWYSHEASDNFPHSFFSSQNAAHAQNLNMVSMEGNWIFLSRLRYWDHISPPYLPAAGADDRRTLWHSNGSGSGPAWWETTRQGVLGSSCITKLWVCCLYTRTIRSEINIFFYGCLHNWGKFVSFVSYLTLKLLNALMS